MKNGTRAGAILLAASLLLLVEPARLPPPAGPSPADPAPYRSGIGRPLM